MSNTNITPLKKKKTEPKNPTDIPLGPRVVYIILLVHNHSAASRPSVRPPSEESYWPRFEPGMSDLHRGRNKHTITYRPPHLLFYKYMSLNPLNLRKLVTISKDLSYKKKTEKA